MSDSTTIIRQLVPKVSNLLRPLAPDDPKELRKLTIVHLKSMRREFSEMTNKDDAAIQELDRQIGRLERLAKS